MLRNTLATLGVLALAAGVVILAAPRAAHAIAATLVQVTNTSANPVINLDVDSPGRSPYYQNATCIITNSNLCSIQFPPVPANSRLVVQFISSDIVTVTALQTAGFLTSPNTLAPILHTFQGNDSSGDKIYVASQPMLYYWEAGQTPQFNFYALPGDSAMVGSVTLTGYLVNLTQ